MAELPNPSRAQRFDAVFGAGRGHAGSGSLEGHEGPALAYLRQLTRDAELGQLQPLLDAIASARTRPLRAEVRARLQEDGSTALTAFAAAQTATLPAELLAAVSVASLTEPEQARLTTRMRDWMEETVFLTASGGSQPTDVAQLRALSERLAAEALCALLTDRCVADSEPVLAGWLDEYDWRAVLGAQLKGWTALTDWARTVHEWPWQQVWLGTLVRAPQSNALQDPVRATHPQEPGVVTADALGNLDLRRQLLCQELAALHDSGV